MGVESVAVTAGVIENPRRNVPLATMMGLVISAVLYIATCTVLMGMIPMEKLADADAPFVTAAVMMAGPIGGTLMGICAIMKAGASLVGWTLTISQISYATAKDGMFPPFYRHTDRRGVPDLNLIISALLMSAVVVATASPSRTSQFNRIINMSIILVILPYLYSAVTFIIDWWARVENRLQQTGLIAVFVTASVYCFGVVYSSDAGLVRDGMVFLFLSVPLYVFAMKKTGPAT
jgi:arginine:agmatine antiporter